MSYRIYHNPRCSKSRQTLELLHEKGIDVSVIEYLNTPPSKSELENIISLLGIEARALLRTTQEEYKLAGLDDHSKSDDEIINAMIAYPILIERPIVIKNGTSAAIGRPPQAVLKLIGIEDGAG